MAQALSALISAGTSLGSVLSKQTLERKKSTQLFCSISAAARKAMLLKAEISWHKAQLTGGLIQAGMGGTGVYSSKEQ